MPADQLLYIREGDYPAAVGDEVKTPLPETHPLYQNYPNPFNPATAIVYDLPEASHVSLHIYNIAGQHVATLISEHQNAGRYAVSWDASEYANGLYVYRLKAGTFTKTRRMVHLK